MLRSLKDLESYDVSATDGGIGHVVDFLLDDELWKVRFLVVDAGTAFEGRRVLISPNSFREAVWISKTFQLALTREKIWDSPSVDTNLPVSRQHEQALNSYYAFPNYWGEAAHAVQAAVGLVDESTAINGAAMPKAAQGDVHLHSAHELHGYHIKGSDSAIGHVEDFVVDDQTWDLRYLVIDTSNWWYGKKVLVAPDWATSVSFPNRTVTVALTQNAIRESPEWLPNAPVNREYEERLYDYYGRPAYWVRNNRIVEPPAPL